MKAIIIFRNISEISSYSFTSPLSDWIKESYPGSVVSELDNQSEVSLFTYIEKLIDESDSVLLIVEEGADTDTGIGKIVRIISEKKEKASVLILDEKSNLVRYFPIKENVFLSENETAQKDFIKTFLTHQ